ncbi:hypothetical protein EJ110_NYTH19851 [Nymphaea thermarum]|nr:hypothetical protein EJ110_NYTH19851 [Nymphaea thermarum]
MEAATSSLVFRPPVSGHRISRRSSGRLCLQVVAASRKDANSREFSSKIVDENMIVLRMRINEMKMVERNQEAPEDWMEWEKRYYASYDSDVCKGVGMLQTFFMNTRPSVALGMLALLGFSVPSSVFLMLINLIEVGKGVADLATLH